MKFTVSIEKHHAYVLMGLLGMTLMTMVVIAVAPQGVATHATLFTDLILGKTSNNVQILQPGQRLGIGTDSPVTTLDVLGGAAFQGNNLYIRNTANTPGRQTWGFVVNGGDGAFHIGQTTDTPPSGGSITASRLILLNDGSLCFGGQCRKGFPTLSKTCGPGACATTTGTSQLSCDAGTRLYGGGCSCDTTLPDISLNFVRASKPISETTWVCVCGSSGSGSASFASISILCG